MIDLGNVGLRRNLQSAFTLVELIVVLALIGIISAIAFPRMQGVDSYQSAILHSSIKSSLRLAQKTALAQHSSTVYWVLQRTAQKQWQTKLLVDEDVSDTTAAIDVTPAVIAAAISGNEPVSAETTLTGSVAFSESVAVSENLLVSYNQLGDIVAIKHDIDLTDYSSFPSVSDEVEASVQFSDDYGSFCLALTGYVYEASCR